MKKLTAISLFIFWAIVTALLTAGLVFYQNDKNQSGSLVQDTLNQNIPVGGSLTLNLAEISKHNKTSACWMLISGKVYDITSYFGSHPGGNSTMAPTCGTDATAAYMTQDPYASSSGSRSAHSSKARGLLTDYYLGDLNQIITN